MEVEEAFSNRVSTCFRSPLFISHEVHFFELYIKIGRVSETEATAGNTHKHTESCSKLICRKSASIGKSNAQNTNVFEMVFTENPIITRRGAGATGFGRAEFHNSRVESKRWAFDEL